MLQQAVLRSREYINSGYNRIVDMDLKSFLDEVDHCLLLQLLYRKVNLIRKWLRSPIQIGGKAASDGRAYCKAAYVKCYIMSLMCSV
jgi:hypothetical protein